MSEPSTRYQQTRGISYLYMAAAFVIVVAGVKAAAPILNPLLLAVFLSVISAPAYFKLRSRGVSEWLSLLTVIAGLSIFMFGVLFFVTRSIASFTNQQQHYQDRLEEEERKFVQTVESWIPDWAKPQNEAATAVEERSSNLQSSTEEDSNSEADDSSPADSQADSPTDSQPDSENLAGREVEDTEQPQLLDGVPLLGDAEVFSNTKATAVEADSQTWMEWVMHQLDPGTAISLAGTFATSLSKLLSNAFLILLTVIFILLEASTFTRKVSEAFVRTEEANERAQQIVDSVQHYIIIKTWVSLATGILVGLWLNLWGVSHAPLWGLLAFLFNYIPNVGSILAAIPAVLVAWLELTWLPAVACAVGFAVVNGAIGNFIEPRMMGKSLGLSPLVVFFSMIFWGWVLGPVGMLLSVPLTMTARIAMDGFEDTRWIATFMGNAN